MINIGMVVATPGVKIPTVLLGSMVGESTKQGMMVVVVVTGVSSEDTWGGSGKPKTTNKMVNNKKRPIRHAADLSL